MLPTTHPCRLSNQKPSPQEAREQIMGSLPRAFIIFFSPPPGAVLLSFFFFSFRTELPDNYTRPPPSKKIEIMSSCPRVGSDSRVVMVVHPSCPIIVPFKKRKNKKRRGTLRLPQPSSPPPPPPLLPRTPALPSPPTPPPPTPHPYCGFPPPPHRTPSPPSHDFCYIFCAPSPPSTPSTPPTPAPSTIYI